MFLANENGNEKGEKTEFSVGEVLEVTRTRKDKLKSNKTMLCLSALKLN